MLIVPNVDSQIFISQLPVPGIEPVPPASEADVVTTTPPRSAVDHTCVSVSLLFSRILCTELFVYKIQEAICNVGSHVNFITLVHLRYFPANKCKATRHKNVKETKQYLKLKH